jgi:hypothetical protein
MSRRDAQVQSLTTTSEPLVVVETNNFHKALKHFTMRGRFKNERTIRLSIPCTICLAKNLAVINPYFDESADCSTHEFYTVLRCGHAFGFTCLNRVNHFPPTLDVDRTLFLLLELLVRLNLLTYNSG